MPYEGICEGETKGPRQVHEDATVHCPECDREMHVVKSFERTDGAFVSRHYRHNRRDGAGGGGGGGASCGESDAHIKYKSIAASQLENIFAENCWKCEMEYRLPDTATDADHRDADALLLFDERDEQLGQGIAAEVQYKNKTKDKRAVERDYIENDIATLWLEPDDFGDHRMRLSEADIRHRAAEVGKQHMGLIAGYSIIRAPDPTPPNHADRLLYALRDELDEQQVPATLPEPVVDTLRYRESDWGALFHDHPADHFRAQAAVPRSAVTTPDQPSLPEPIVDTLRYRESDWGALFGKEPAPVTSTELTFTPDLPTEYVTHEAQKTPVDGTFYTRCRGCGKELGPYHPRIKSASHQCSCGTVNIIDTTHGIVERTKQLND